MYFPWETYTYNTCFKPRKNLPFFSIFLMSSLRYSLPVALLIAFLPTQALASVSLSSLLSNPAWDDTLGEYIEVRNTGCSSVDISGYRLSDLSGKIYTLWSGTTIASHENKKFPYRETKIILNNTGDESVYLRSTTGVLIDSYSYSGTQRDDVILSMSLTDEVCSIPIVLTGSTSTSSWNLLTQSWMVVASTGSTNSTGTIIYTWSTLSWSSVYTGSTNTGSISIGDMISSGMSNIWILTDTGSLSPASWTMSDTGTSISPSGSWVTLSPPSSDIGSISSASGMTENLSGSLIDPVATSIGSDTNTWVVAPIDARGSNSWMLVNTEIISTWATVISSGSTSSPVVSLSGSTNSGILASYTETGLLSPMEIYYSDSSQDGKIDTLEIIYPYTLTGRVNMGTIALYSATGWLYSARVNTSTGYIVSGSLSGNILILHLLEWDIEKTTLKVNNTTTSELRLKSLWDLGYRSIGWQVSEDLLLTKSFDDYRRVYKKNIQSSDGLTTYAAMTSTGSSNTGIILSSSGWNVWSSGSIRIPVSFPDIILTLQSPTNATLSWEIFTCLTPDCRVNLTLEPIFSSGYAMRDYQCYFGTGETLTLDDDCNPNTIYFSTSWSLTIELVSKKDMIQKSRKVYWVDYRSTNSISPEIRSTSPTSPLRSPDTGKPRAILKIDGKWQDYYEKIGDYELNCHTATCSLNWTAEDSYDPEGSKVHWLWIYGPNDISTSRDPGTRKYGLWDHSMILRVVDSTWNYTEIWYIIHVLGPKPEEEKVKKEKISKSENREKKEKKILSEIRKKKKHKKMKMIFFSPPIVLLQGRTGEKISEDLYACRYKKTPLCSMNFSLSGTLKWYDYVWQLDGEEIFTGKNPKVWKLASGVYDVRVISYHAGSWAEVSRSDFTIRVSAEPKKAKKIKTKKPKFSKKIKIPKIIPEVQAKTQDAENPDVWGLGAWVVLFGSGILLWYIVKRRRRSL